MILLSQSCDLTVLKSQEWCQDSQRDYCGIYQAFQKRFLALRRAGVTTEQALLDKENSIHPDYYTDQLSDLLEVKEATVVAA